MSRGTAPENMSQTAIIEEIEYLENQMDGALQMILDDIDGNNTENRAAMDKVIEMLAHTDEYSNNYEYRTPVEMFVECVAMYRRQYHLEMHT